MRRSLARWVRPIDVNPSRKPVSSKVMNSEGERLRRMFRLIDLHHKRARDLEGVGRLGRASSKRAVAVRA